MTTENAIEETGRELIVPLTGELINLDDATDEIARITQQIREMEQELYRARNQLNAELVRRLDHENLRKAEIGPYVISVDAPNSVDWDAKELEAVLHDLVDHDELSAEAVDRILPLKRSVSIRELKKLIGTLDDDLSAKIEACSAPSRKLRRVKIESQSA